jgi:diguanylate cyclase (GGDEF)-like protein
LAISLAFLWSENKESAEIQARLAYVLVAGCVYVLITAFMPFYRLNPRQWERACLAADIGFISAAVFFSGGATSNYQLLYYLPIVHASLRLGLREVLEAALLVAGAYLFVHMLEGWVRPGQVYLGPESFIFIGIGFLLAIFMGTLARENREHIRYRERAKKLVDELREANAQLSDYSIKLERLSISDPLTGALNRRGLEQKMEEELSRARRFRRPLSVLLVDMDGLKKYNDRYGHYQGDLAIAHLGRVLREGVRGIDIVARYGGDEFVVILPETDKEGAGNLAEKARNSPALLAANAPQVLKANLGLTIGCATFPEDGDLKEQLLHKADMAMYASKRVRGKK